jgi:hypothetical protein
LPHDLGNCVQCGEKEISPAVCSVNLKHIAAYHDIVKQVSLYSHVVCVCVYAFFFFFFSSCSIICHAQGHQLSIILEDDIALSGPEPVTEVKKKTILDTFLFYCLFYFFHNKHTHTHC